MHSHTTDLPQTGKHYFSLGGVLIVLRHRETVPLYCRATATGQWGRSLSIAAAQLRSPCDCAVHTHIYISSAVSRPAL